MFDLRKHNYCEKVMKLVEEGKIPFDWILLVDVYHDDWCGINQGGYCNCDPDVRLRPPPEVN